MATAEYGAPFAPRAGSLAPGHLVALAYEPDGRPVVLWRWYDAVVVGEVDRQVTLWEPGHGEVLAQKRDQQRKYVPGTRAYASAGLPGAAWWVEGPVSEGSAADVSVEAVDRFYLDNNLWAIIGD